MRRGSERKLSIEAMLCSSAHLARLAADHTEEVRTLLVRAALVGSVARRALGLEELGSGLGLSVVRTRHLSCCASRDSDNLK